MGQTPADIYLDYNATGPVHPEVADAVMPFLRGTYGNPSAPYAVGRTAKKALGTARRQIAALLGAGDPGTIVFTGGGTESSNLAIKGLFYGSAGARPGAHLVISAIEHPAVLETCRWLESRGAELTLVPVGPDGRVDADAVEEALRPETVLVSVMHANNETGVLQPVEEIGRRLRDRSLWYHIDGVQAAGKIPVNVADLGCDSYAISGHKFGGLKGTGALFVRDESRLQWVQQGGHQERGLRGGTENVPGIAALGKAAEIALRDADANRDRCLAARAPFDELVTRIPMCRLNGHSTLRLPNTVNLCCLYADAMNVVLVLSTLGISIGTGSACASHNQAPSRILKAMGLSDRAAFCSVRISTGPATTIEDARHAADSLVETVERIRLVTAPEDIGTCDDNCPCFLGEE